MKRRASTSPEGRQVSLKARAPVRSSEAEMAATPLLRPAASLDPAPYRSLFENNPQPMLVYDLETLAILEVNEAMVFHYGYSREEFLALTIKDIRPEEDIPALLANVARTTGALDQSSGWRHRKKDGTIIEVEITSHSLFYAGRPARLVLVKDVTELKRVERETLRRNEELAALNEVGRALSRLAQPADMLRLIYEMIGKVLDNRNFYIALYDAANQQVTFPIYTIEGELQEPRSRPLGNGLTEYVIHSQAPLLIPHDLKRTLTDLGISSIGREAQCLLSVPMLAEGKVIGVITLQDYVKAGVYEAGHVDLLLTFASQAAVALENARLFDETTRRLAELKSINKVSTALSAAQTVDEMLPLLLRQTLEVLVLDRGSIWLYDNKRNELRPVSTQGWGEAPLPAPEKPGEGICGYVFASEELQIVPEACRDSRLPEEVRRRIPSGLGEVALPIRAGEQVIGILSVNTVLPRELTPSEIRLLTTLSEIAGNAIQRARLHQETEHRLRQLRALREIDKAIGSSLDLHLNLEVVLNQVIPRLHVDAATILLANPAGQTLRYGASRGFRSHALQYTNLRLGEGLAGTAAYERRLVYLPDIREHLDGLGRSPLLSSEGFVSYFGVPLMAKGRVKGVLEIFHRTRLEPEGDWLDFLEALAGQAAIAIDNAELFDGLQRSNTQLALAYETTLEGWSSALDLRDKETEGHTQRVTEMTVSLAQAFGFNEEELLNVRRGALLHDIGKMGIPDSILLKPGPLTNEEWEVMRRHPEFAYQLLSPIAYLKEALDIPYCHHEKWDGSGYPRGLRGEQIPLAARIFAVVDVWDALRSDRPYRRPWQPDQVLAHIRSQSGSHFEPRIVKVFLPLARAAGGDGQPFEDQEGLP